MQNFLISFLWGLTCALIAWEIRGKIIGKKYKYKYKSWKKIQKEPLSKNMPQTTPSKVESVESVGSVETDRVVGLIDKSFDPLISDYEQQPESKTFSMDLKNIKEVLKGLLKENAGAISEISDKFITVMSPASPDSNKGHGEAVLSALDSSHEDPVADDEVIAAARKRGIGDKSPVNPVNPVEALTDFLGSLQGPN